MENAKNQIADIIKNNANILVSVSTDPSVDELSAALGLTILLNNMDKRATAVFSGAIPPAIEFMEPGKTFENTADSLRDFIIALDKEKADHLRYKVEGDVVKIFITPYKSTLSKDDLDFSQGDYNVEVVIGLGVKDQNHLDKALEAHGKILHDANVVTITAGPEISNLGAIDWHEDSASSLSEMIVGLADALKQDKPLLDEQISTALLTGIVSSTARFSNDKTTSRAMTIAAQLMAAGANQQLIAAKLEEAHDIEPSAPAVADEPKTQEAPKEDTEQETELSIKRSDRAPKTDEPAPVEAIAEAGLAFEATNLDVKAADEPVEEKNEEKNDAATPDESSTGRTEEATQAELEKQLADLNVPVAGTLADIEKELAGTVETPAENVEESKGEVSELQPALSSPPEAEVKLEETTLPELPALPTLDTAQETPSELSLPPLEPLPEPQIINEHGTFSEKPVNEPAPINSIQNDPTEGEATIDPFNNDTNPTVSVPPLAPLSSDVGTPEGAALLAGNTNPAPVPVAEPITIPPLPPLPPLPVDGLPPLPPPPPLPPTFDPSPAANPSGAVSGDVFGDGTTSAAPRPAPQTASEPGQFRIPGQ